MVRRKKGAGCVGDGELKEGGGSVLRFRNLNGINIGDRGFRHWVAVNHIFKSQN